MLSLNFAGLPVHVFSPSGSQRIFHATFFASKDWRFNLAAFRNLCFHRLIRFVLHKHFFGLHSREIESTAQSAESKKHPKKETQTKKNRKKTAPNNAAKAPGRGDSERRKGTAEIETRRIYPNSNVINFYIATYKTGPRHKSDFNILSLSGFDNRKISFFFFRSNMKTCFWEVGGFVCFLAPPRFLFLHLINGIVEAPRRKSYRCRWNGDFFSCSGNFSLNIDFTRCAVLSGRMFGGLHANNRSK